MELPFNIADNRIAIIFIGIQASGKTTFYNTALSHHGFCHINLDTLKTRHRESELFRSCLTQGRNIVVDNTNPAKVDRARYIPLARGAGYKVIGIFFQSILRHCIARNELRGETVPRHAIPNTQNKLEMPGIDEGFDELYFVKIKTDGFDISKWKD